ncbi:MAG TPA: J domain-containing protein [Oscillospiraceae bacterium]|nr:J domain-containing protein [Oscillospiraceae bacterium]
MNNDPYSILGVSRNASDDEIKDAYRELAKKYHPDNYDASPLNDLAKERMQEINAAYDEITRTRKASRGANASNSYGGTSGGYSGSSSYYSIRILIQNRQLEQADAQLEQVPEIQRDAEWYFLKGSVCYSRGWINEAYQYFSRAYQLNPSNPEYASAFKQMSSRRAGNMAGNPYGGYRTTHTGGGCSGCDMCTGLLCADCCCECMGGDLIACC